MKRATQFMVDKVGPLQAEPLDEGAQPSLTVPHRPSACRHGRPSARRSRSPVSMAMSEYAGSRPRCPVLAGVQVASASGVTHTVTRPRCCSARSYCRQFSILYLAFGLRWRRGSLGLHLGSRPLRPAPNPLKVPAGSPPDGIYATKPCRMASGSRNSSRPGFRAGHRPSRAWFGWCPRSTSTRPAVSAPNRGDSCGTCRTLSPSGAPG
jgi:hypothetical protein